MERDAYRDAGVDIDAAMHTKRGIREMVRSTFRPEVLSDIGAFGGLFKPDFSGIDDPVLVFQYFRSFHELDPFTIFSFFR